MVRAAWMVVVLVGCTPAPPPEVKTGDYDVPVKPGGLLPLPDATKAQVCADDCLLLTRYDFNTVKHRYRDLCCTDDALGQHARCDQPWPWSGKPTCPQVELLRNCLSAKYGKVFSDPDWQQHFDKQSWYQQDGTFNPGTMSINAKRNDMALMQILLNEEQCTPDKDTKIADSWKGDGGAADVGPTTTTVDGVE